MKKYLFENQNLTLIVKAPVPFMAACYANEYMEQRSLLSRFETSDAMEIENDQMFGVIAAKIEGDKFEWYGAENPWFDPPESIKAQIANTRKRIKTIEKTLKNANRSWDEVFPEYEDALFEKARQLLYSEKNKLSQLIKSLKKS